MTPTEQIRNARRWDKCVDYASPTTAWTDEMLRAEIERKKEAQK